MSHFDGETYDPAVDGRRLTGQLQAVSALMRDQEWRTLRDIADTVHGSEAGVSARLRDLRKPRFGAWTVERRYVGERPSGLWAYRVLPPAPVDRPLLALMGLSR